MTLAPPVHPRPVVKDVPERDPHEFLAEHERRMRELQAFWERVERERSGPIVRCLDRPWAPEPLDQMARRVGVPPFILRGGVERHHRIRGLRFVIDGAEWPGRRPKIYPTSRAVVCRETGERFPSITHAAIALSERRGRKVWRNSIAEAVRDGSTAFGFHFDFADDAVARAGGGGRS